MPKILKTNYSELESDPIKYILTRQLSEKQITNLLQRASHYYYETEQELISDTTFDILKEYLEEKYPQNPFLQQIGATVKGPDKVKLPIHMGSMDKKKTQKDIANWILKYPSEVIISDKLDGISFLLVIKNGIKLFTRGNGTEGKDISKLLPYLKLPKLDANLDIIIRGEMLVSQSNFEYVKDKFKNGRSFVSGMSNLKELNPERMGFLKLIDLVCYELVKPNLKTEEQLKYLEKLKLQVVPHQKLPNINFAKLEQILLGRKEKSKYDIDGIIITANQVNPRVTSGNPKYSFAFKMDLESKTTKVIKVEWNASKHGKLKPIVYIEPVYLNGTTNSKATGNNADFINKNKIGPGSIVKIIKGGEIIPKIEKVIQGTQAQFPPVKYKWNETHKEIILLDLNNSVIEIKKLVAFFKTIGVENLGPGLIQKMYENQIDTIKKICLVTAEELLELDGIKEKSADKIVLSLKKVIQKPIPLAKIISGASLFGDGIGEKIILKIINHYQIQTASDFRKLDVVSLKSIDGIEEKTAVKILKAISEVEKFLLGHPFLKYQSLSLGNKTYGNKTGGKLNGLDIVITGKRDKSVLEFIEKEGGNIKTAVNSKTQILILDDLQSTSSKNKKAQELGVSRYLVEQFKKKYHI